MYNIPIFPEVQLSIIENVVHHPSDEKTISVDLVSHVPLIKHKGKFLSVRDKYVVAVKQFPQKNNTESIKSFVRKFFLEKVIATALCAEVTDGALNFGGGAAEKSYDLISELLVESVIRRSMEGVSTRNLMFPLSPKEALKK